MGIIWLAFKSLLNFILYQTVMSLFCLHQVTALFLFIVHLLIPTASPDPAFLSPNFITFFFFLVLLQKTDPLEINSYVANMKQILSIGAEETIVCQFFKQQYDTPSPIQDVVQYLRRVCVSGWSCHSRGSSVWVCACVFQRDSLQKHAMGRQFVSFQKAL